MMKFNINSSVKVKLTEVGVKELKRQHEELCNAHPNIDMKFTLTVDEEGYSTFQMYSLMHQLGHLCNLGGKLPFATIILIGDKVDGDNSTESGYYNLI